jgi:hypothetical protein
MGAHPGTEKIRNMNLAAVCDMNKNLLFDSILCP